MATQPTELNVLAELFSLYAVHFLLVSDEERALCLCNTLEFSGHRGSVDTGR